MDFFGDCTKYSSLDFDAINFGLYLSSAEKVQNRIDDDTESSYPISITRVFVRRAVQGATKSLSVEEN